MVLLRLSAYLGIVLSLSVAAPGFAATEFGVRKAHPVNTQVVKQPDGSVVERLALTSTPARWPRWISPINVGTVPDSVSEQSQRLGAWLESVTEPQAMTALAAIPGAPRDAGQKLPDMVDPAMVRNWAEFMDPTLALRWKALAEMNGFIETMPQRPEAGSKALKAAPPGNPWARVLPWVNKGLGITWRNAVSEGSKRSLTGQQALQEWLMLPMPELKSNPWLSSLGSYRY